MLAAVKSDFSRADISRLDVPHPLNQIYNIAVVDRTTLNELFYLLRDNLHHFLMESAARPSVPPNPIYRNFRPGDVRHSLADISKAQRLLGYAPTHRIGQGLELVMSWYVAKLNTWAL